MNACIKQIINLQRLMFVFELHSVPLKCLVISVLSALILIQKATMKVSVLNKEKYLTKKRYIDNWHHIPCGS